MRVLVVGGGPTGLTLAIELRRRGVAVRIVDKATRFFEGSRGDGIQPRTFEVLDDLGVLDEVMASALAPVPVRVHLDGVFTEERWMYRPSPASPDVPYPTGHVLGQSRLEDILRRRLAGLGAVVELGTEVHRLVQDDGGVTVTFASGEAARFDYVVGADGGASTVRKQIGVAFPGTTDETFRMLVGDVVVPGLAPTAAYWFASGTDPRTGVVLTPLPEPDTFVFNTELGAGDDASLETMQAHLDHFSAGLRLQQSRWSTVWRPNVRLAERYRVGRVFLAGDAAHVHPPTGGQGMNTGIQDAYNLGWKLAGQTALDTYETERRGEAARVLGVSADLLERFRSASGDAHRRGAEHSGLTVTYRDPDDDGHLVTGDRAPDAPVTDADGNAVRLFDLFRGPHFTRLVFGAEAPEAEHSYAVLKPGERASGRFVVDEGGHAYAAYRPAPGASVLIRPDGYLA